MQDAEFGGVHLFSKRRCGQTLGRVQAGERATFVPAQEAPFSDDRQGFIGEYAGLMRRIPQAGATESASVRRVPKRETFLEVLDSNS